MKEQCIAFIEWFLGGYDGLLYTLFAFLIVDYVTGVVCAIAVKKFTIKAACLGIYKKILIITIVGIATLLEHSIVKTSSVLRMAVILFYVATEGVSILKNANALGLNTPKPLVDLLEFIGYPVFKWGSRKNDKKK